MVKHQIPTLTIIILNQKKIMKKIITFAVIALVISTNLNAQKQVKISPADLKIMEGNWVGTLTYLDYKSNQPFTMPANTSIQQSKDNPNFFLRSLGYSQEPKANQNDTLVIGNKGTTFDDYTIIEYKKLTPDSIVIITEKKGVDGNDNKPALLRHTYTITDHLFINKKEVKFVGTDKWLVRNEYKFIR